MPTGYGKMVKKNKKAPKGKGPSRKAAAAAMKKHANKKKKSKAYMGY